MKCDSCGRDVNIASSEGGFLSYRGILCEFCDAQKANVCDFCSSPQVSWIYPASDFKTPWVTRSKGAWAACQRCHDLIESRQYVRLLDICMKICLRKLGAGGATRATKGVLRREIAQFHNDFRAHRTGDAYRIDN